jgi:Fe-S-cluster-containing hydrogenase component 2
MDAIALGPEDVAQVDLRRCIGCGLCVTTCPTEAIRLELKPDAQRRDPPQTAQETLMQLAQERGTSLIPLAAMKAAES